MSEEVTITAEEYESLRRAADRLAALERAGVDNWEGYSAVRDREENDAAADEIAAELDGAWWK